MRFLLKRIIYTCKHQYRTMTVTNNLSKASYSSNAPKCLPVPNLDETLTKFLRSVRPLLNQAELEKTTLAVENFKQQGGARLQQLLEERGKKLDNWLEEYWLNTAYLEYRDPVPVFSSPGLVWSTFCGFDSEDSRLQCTAHLISAALDFNQLLRCRAIPQEKAGNDPLDMEQYYRVFGTTRIPLAKRDKLEMQNGNSIIVMANNNMFSLDVYDENNGDKHLEAGAIYHMLREVVKQSENAGPPLGVLTSDHRDNWARAYALLCQNKKNFDALHLINRALFVVCLDRPLPDLVKARNTGSKTSKLLIHGGGFSHGNAANRWFDKTIQFVIGASNDGVGISYEHSPAEGGPIGVLSDFIHDKMKQQSPVKMTKNHPKPVKLEFEIDGEIEKAIAEAGRNIDRLANDLDLFAYKCSDFGKNELKQLKVSPDSFIQVAIQYAFYKVHGKVASQYESGTLRRFAGGRTDVIRTCSEEVAAFCRSGGDVPARAALLRNALNAHKNYANEVVAFKGIDRHLLGLKIIARQHGLPLPQLYCDKGYIDSTTFRLSTSNVPSLMDAFMIYGPLTDDGYGCCYNPRNNDINFGLSAWANNPNSNLDQFQAALDAALNEMRIILQKAIETPKAKL